MQSDLLRILAINPGLRHIGFASFSGSNLLDWGVKRVRAKTARGRLRVARAILVELVERFQTSTVAVKRLHPSRSSTYLNRLALTINELAGRRKLRVLQYSIGELKQAFGPEAQANRHKLAEAVAAMYPVLASQLHAEQRNRHSYHLRAFEAVALGIVASEKLDAAEK